MYCKTMKEAYAVRRTVPPSAEIEDHNAPPHTAGAVHVTVKNDGGESTTSPADQFTYVAAGPAPAITKLSPKKAPLGDWRNLRDHHRDRLRRGRGCHVRLNQRRELRSPCGCWVRRVEEEVAASVRLGSAYVTGRWLCDRGGQRRLAARSAAKASAAHSTATR